jgi:MFS family permease
LAFVIWDGRLNNRGEVRPHPDLERCVPLRSVFSEGIVRKIKMATRKTEEIPPSEASGKSVVKDTSIFKSLRNPLFRMLWLATMVSGICVSAHDTAATWMMHATSGSTFYISLMSTVAALPFFLFTLPAGAFADMVDRKLLTCGLNLWLAAVASALAVIGFLGLLSPWIILTSVFLLGIGFAFNATVWSSIVPEIVADDELPSAITIGGLQLSLSGVIGPAIGGLILSRTNANVVFALNAVCFLLVIVAVSRWKQVERSSKLPLETFFETFAGAIRYLRYAPGIQVVLARNVLFALFISVIPALLPVVGLMAVHMNSENLGWLYTSMGIGSVAGAVLLIPRARARFTPNTLTIVASTLLAVVFVLMALVRQLNLFLVVSALAGVAWTMAASELWVAGQRAMPPWARGRMNATHIMLSQGGMALGGLVWGGLAMGLGLEFALFTAAFLLLASLFLAFPLSINFANTLSFDLAHPTTRYHERLNIPRAGDGPVAIAMEFQIDAVNRAHFLLLMREVRLMHLRNGAFSWRLDEDLSGCHRFRLEMLVSSWSEHLLQHERMTKNEHAYLERAWSLDLRKSGPDVKHYLSVNREIINSKAPLPSEEPENPSPPQVSEPVGAVSK